MWNDSNKADFTTTSLCIHLQCRDMKRFFSESKLNWRKGKTTCFGYTLYVEITNILV